MKILGSSSLTAVGLAGVLGLLLNINCGSGDGGSGGGTGGSATGGHGTGGNGTGGHGTGGNGTGTGGNGTGGATGGTAGGSATGGAAGDSATGGAAGSSATGGAAGSSATGGGGATGGIGGAGGVKATGGMGGAGGVKATGGAGGAGGVKATGGAGGAGGVKATGGAGGVQGSGGAGGTAGHAGASGAAGGAFDGGTLAGTALFTFDANNQGFALNIYNGSANSLDGTTVDGSARATLAWTGDEGDPSVGALVSDASFSAYNQFTEVEKTYPLTGQLSLAGKTTLHIRVRVVSGLDAFPGVQPFVQSETAADGGTGVYVECFKYNSVPTGHDWHEYTLDLTSCPTGFDATKIQAIGVDILSGGAPTQDSGAPPAPTPAVVYIDSFSVS